MSRLLCIDRGNTRVKVAVFENDIILEQAEAPQEETENLVTSFVEKHKPDGSIVCSVSGGTETIVSYLKEQMKHVVKLDADTRLPIMNAYSSPETLGVDRLAIAVGAQHKHPDKNILAISLGTCITYNFVQKNKAFRGGAISPGLQMRIRSMHEFTHGLPEINVEGEVLLLGYDTATSMRSGAVFGMASEIDGMVAAFEAQYPDFNAELTGGDTAMFGKKLKREIFADPDLLLRGLQLILLHNAPQLR